MSVSSQQPLLLTYSSNAADGAGQTVATLTLNNPNIHNALDHTMFDALESALTQIKHSCDPNSPYPTVHSIDNDANHITRVLVLRANGPSFCSGFHLRDAARAGDNLSPMIQHFLTRLSDCINIISQLPIVSVALVNGAALAGGCALACACDFVVAGPGAQFGYPTHVIGLSPAISSPALCAHMDLGPARALLLSGEKINAARAFELGLASHLVTAPIEEKFNSLVNMLVSNAPNALRTTKRWLQQFNSGQNELIQSGALAASLSSANNKECAQRLAALWKK